MYLVFEYVDKNLLEVLEDKPNGLDVCIFSKERQCPQICLLALQSPSLLSQSEHYPQRHQAWKFIGQPRLNS